MSTFESIPKASLLLHSLRSVGYSEESAIADIVDNSISAHASEIKIDFSWENQEIVIVDNGLGMDKDCLYENMKIGSSDPNDARDDYDLGRFGMGLKTASLSLGKQLVVVTKKEGITSNASWDLDKVDNCGWKLIIDDNGGYDHYLNDYQSSATAVIIKKLDYISEKKDKSNSKKHFYSVIERVANHLSIVFHRYIEEDGLKIYINNDILLEAWDPFVSKNVATQELPSEELWTPDGKDCAIVQPYVLPHKTKFSSEDEYEQAAGYKGWTSNQGIFLYRNRRLIISGTWFNLIRKEPAFNLARIKVDISSSSDEFWKIDIKKSRASLPSLFRERLLSTVIDCTDRSTKVYNSRGAYSRSPLVPKLDFVWEQTKTKRGYLFKINKNHPILSAIRAELSEAGKEKLRSFLSLVENFAPYMKNCMVDTISKNDLKADENEKQSDLSALSNMIHVFYEQGFTKEEIMETIKSMSLYSYLTDQIKEIMETLDDK